MKWVEMIKVRSIGCSIEKLISTVKSLLNELTLTEENSAMHLFRIENLDSDICIVLFHDGKKMSAGGSRLGLYLADAMKEVGLVNHEILIGINQNWLSV